MFDGFKKFLFRGNIVDMAIGIIIGASFQDVIKNLVSGILTPFIGVIARVPDFSGMEYTFLGSKFMPGVFINALISFIIVATAVYFFIMVPMSRVMTRMKKDEMPNTKACKECLTSIHINAKRCPACTSVLS